MPWEQVTVLEKREEFVLLARKVDANVSQLSKRFGISRKTAYKWLNRFDETTPDSLADRSRRPVLSPHKCLPELEAAVLALRKEHPSWGGRKIAYVLGQDQALHIAPSTVTNILHRHQLITPAASLAAKAWTRFEHDEPNSLWQMDFKGHFAVGQQRCHPLTVIDDHSRYNVVLEACQNEQRTTVQAVLQRTFAQYGLPDRINTDNGPPWGTCGQDVLSGLAVWLIRLGVKLSHSRPLHPQTNGKNERFHRTLKAEVLAFRRFERMQQVQPEFDRWRMVYNRERPHEALSMQTPVQRYRASQRSLPKELPPIEYGPDDQVRKVQQDGGFYWRGREFRTSKALAGQPIALRPCVDNDGIYNLYFCHHHLGTFDLRCPDAL